MFTLENTDNDSSNRDSKNHLARLVDLPSLPAMLMEALQYTAGNQSFSSIADKIAQDPPMVVRILRIANSPFYGMAREIGSLQEAILLLGLNRVRDMLIGVCFLNILPARNKDFDYPHFWHHSMAVAACTRQLVNSLGLDQNIAFTAGLLHDIGQLVIVLLFPDDFSRYINELQSHNVETERQVLGFDHVEIGSEAAKRWNLPVTIQEAIELHETPPSQDSQISLGLVVYTANLLISASEQSNDANEGLPEAITNALKVLNISLDQATDWANTSRQFADQIVAIL